MPTVTGGEEVTVSVLTRATNHLLANSGDYNDPTGSYVMDGAGLSANRCELVTQRRNPFAFHPGVCNR